MNRNRIHNMLAFCILAMTTQTGIAASNSIPEVSQVRGLLLSAIESKSGTADAWLVGPMAQKLRAETQAPDGTKVRATVSTVAEIRPGCKRLRLILAMPSHKMLTRNGTHEAFQMAYELNLCRDGQPPQVSSVGLEKTP
ncbi:hypothetical protein F8A86_11440 [Betaproteobacteria bacterium SCN1]|jgi:hypothetical protein|nr:hypothetical protein F8A86_11440 [Betaproteobacteria bacterium SCN1]